MLARTHIRRLGLVTYGRCLIRLVYRPTASNKMQYHKWRVRKDLQEDAPGLYDSPVATFVCRGRKKKSTKNFSQAIP
jgi:hypothetical protein